MDTTAPFLPAERLGEVQDLKPESTNVQVLTPETKVLCVHRGRTTLTDMFDSRHYTIEPGFFITDYGAAKHFQTRAVVPGSRNPETGFQASFLAIIGIAVPKAGGGLSIVRKVDDEVQWSPFTDEECLEYGHAVEAIDRGGLVDPIDRDVTVQPIHGSRIPAAAEKASRVKDTGQGRSARRTQIVGDGAAALAQKNRPGENEATRAIREDMQGKDNER